MHTNFDGQGAGNPGFDKDRITAELIRIALADNPDDGRLWESFGLLCRRLGDTPAACAAFEQASMLVPLAAESQWTLARIYSEMGAVDPAHAIARHLGTWLRTTSDLARVATLLGEMGFHRDALRVCRRIVRAAPGHHPAHYGIAYYQQRLGFGAKRWIPHLAMAMDLAPHILTYRIQLAFAWADLDDTDKAHDLLAGVPPTVVLCPCSLRRMADIHDRAGDHRAARACRERLENQL